MNLELIRIAAQAIGTTYYCADLDTPNRVSFEISGRTALETAEEAEQAVKRAEAAGFGEIEWTSPTQGAGTDWKVWISVNLDSYRAV